MTDALRDLEERNGDSEFRSENLTVSGRILTHTDLKDIPGAEHSDWLTLERDHRILRQGGNYIEKLLATPW